MASSAQIELWHAEKVATQVGVSTATNGIHYAAWGETRISESDLERLVGAVPATLAPALVHRAYYFIPLAIADTGETLIAPAYTVELGDRAVCHRNALFGATEAVFLSTRLVEDRFGLAQDTHDKVAILRETAKLWETRGTDELRAFVVGEPGRDPEACRMRMISIKRPSDGWSWGGTFD